MDWLRRSFRRPTPRNWMDRKTPMNFELSNQQRELQETARKFAQKELVDVARDIEASDEPLPIEWRRRYANVGFLGVNLPEEYGGLGLSHFDALLVLEQFAMISPAVAWPIFESATGPVRIIEQF